MYSYEGKQKIRSLLNLFQGGKKTTVLRTESSDKSKNVFLFKVKDLPLIDSLQIPASYHKQDFNDSPSPVCLHGGITTDSGCHGDLKQVVWLCSLCKVPRECTFCGSTSC